MTRLLRFLDGSTYDVPADTCRGCFMESPDFVVPPELEPVFESRDVVVRQDAEWPVPGFYVVSVRHHIGSIDRMPPRLYEHVMCLTRLVRLEMASALAIERVQMYHEEKLERPHFHLWLLPLWPSVMARHQINPRVYEGNIARYLGLFSFEDHQRTILSYNALLRSSLRSGETLE